MLIHVARLGDPVADLPAEQIEAAVPRQRTTRHRVVSDPEDADIVLFTQPHMLTGDLRLRRIRSSATFRRYASKSYVYDERDLPTTGLRGAYVSMPEHSFNPRRMVVSPYLNFTEYGDLRTVQPDLLFSFVGSPTATCREAIFELRHPRGMVDRADGFTFYRDDLPGFADRKDLYREVLGRSKFVLCPRGRGLSSFRMYEVLSAGRVPVVIADGWMPPTGAAWDEFSVRIAEADVPRLPQILEQAEGRFAQMRQRAIEVFDDQFAADVRVNHVLDRLEELHRADAGRRSAPSRADLDAQWADSVGRLRRRAGQARRALRLTTSA